ncbi:MAG: glycosyltransferase family A protein [Granulosicoccus sp.]
MSAKPFISYVVPQRGRYQMLLSTLDSLFKQALRGLEAEIIIVTQDDDLSLDGVFEALGISEPAIPVSLVYGDSSKVISHSRNLGAQQARGQYIAFVDADMALSPEWTSLLIDVLEGDTGSVLAGGSQVLSTGAGTVETLRAAMTNLGNDTGVAYLPGHNLILSREIYDRIGGFPEHLITCEDVWFTDKARESGLVWKSSAAAFIHLGEDMNYAALFKKEIWRGRSNLQSLAGRKLELREVPSLLIPPGSLFLVVAAVIALILAKPGYALGALLLLLAAPVAWALRLRSSETQPVRLLPAIWMYLLYFIARGIGMIAGLLPERRETSHA